MEKVKPQLYDKLTQQERRELRQRYVEAQKHTCLYCKLDLRVRPEELFDDLPEIDWTLFPKHFLKYQIHLHHNHNTGLTIGAVHAYCNAILFYYHGE